MYVLYALRFCLFLHTVHSLWEIVRYLKHCRRRAMPRSRCFAALTYEWLTLLYWCDRRHSFVHCLVGCFGVQRRQSGVVDPRVSSCPPATLLDFTALRTAFQHRPSVGSSTVTPLTVESSTPFISISNMFWYLIYTPEGHNVNVSVQFTVGGAYYTVGLIWLKNNNVHVFITSQSNLFLKIVWN